MKRIMILSGALLLPAAVGISGLRQAGDAGAPLTPSETQETSVTVRRLYEGPDPDFWGTCPSPDGRYVTQTDWETGDLAVLDLLTGEKRRVTSKGDDGWETSIEFSEAACFSPDGQRIAYVWLAEPETYELRVINVDGTDSRLLARAGYEPEDPPSWYEDVWEWWPDLHGWSPDGQHLLVTFYYGDRVEVTLLSVEDGSRAILYESQGELQFAALSPSGRYLGYGKDGDLFVRPVSGGDAVAVAAGRSEDLFIGWTESGDLLYLSDRDLTEGVWRVPMEDGRPAGQSILVAGDLWGMEPIGVAGNSLVYGIDTQAPRLHVVRVDLTRNRVLGAPTPVESQMRESNFAAWSPDGLNLMYLIDDFTPERRLMLRSTSNGETTDVTPGFLTLERDQIRWSEDGRQVLIPGREPGSGRAGFFAYTLSTGEVEYVFSPDEIAGVETGGVEFSRDWGTVYLHSRERHDGPVQLLRRNLATGDQRTLMTRANRSDGWRQPIQRTWPSPDDRYLAFWELANPDTARMLRVMSTDGGEPRTLLTVHSSAGITDYPDCFDGITVPWTNDSRHVLAVLDESVQEEDSFAPHLCRLYKVPVEGGEPIFVGAIPKPGKPWALSPDDSRLGFQVGESRGEIWILDGLEGR